jgi:dolichyl-diphosphooligosaccharide--protein glycosyltransferase/undecaprenyl-diphosphooligosaccharide--protein glycosyltransferase
VGVYYGYFESYDKQGVNMDKNSLEGITSTQMVGLMVVAYAFSFLMRMIWVWQFGDDPSSLWGGELMINTNDGYFFASGAQQELMGLHTPNPRVFGMWDYGVIFFTTLFVKITPFSLETVILYMPSVISSLVVIPIILISRLYNKTLWGFFSALLASITWSYYNRTMTGYYDTDMFSAMAPMFILFFLIKNTIDFDMRSALWASIAIVFYPFLYDQGQAIVFAMGMIYVAYMVWYHRDESITYKAIILVLISLIPLGIDKPFDYIVHLLLISILYFILNRREFKIRELMITSGVLFVIFLIYSNIFGLILYHILSYTNTGTASTGLHFFSVNQTVREAGQIPFGTFANRTSGSITGVILALIGYLLLVAKHRAFILALPLIGIGIFALWGGLRFTVYAVPIAGMSAIYLFWVVGDYLENAKYKLIFVAVMSGAMIYPNIIHILAYMTPTVMKAQEVEDLVKLDNIASPRDYTLTWWDYGYPIWYYSDTSTLIDGGKHNNDNFIISKIMLSQSPTFTANLSRLAVETYEESNHSIVTTTLFKKGDNEYIDPNLLLSQLEDEEYPLPAKTRDVYLYLSYRMLGIFPTIALFGNLDLTTGEEERDIVFYPTQAVSQSDSGELKFANGASFDIRTGMLTIGSQRTKVKNFIMTEYDDNGRLDIRPKVYDYLGDYSIIFMQNYKKFIIMDTQTLNSTFVQMFMLEKYDKNLFELVVSSPYSKIYKIKK